MSSIVMASELQVFAAADDAVVDAAQHLVGAAHGAEDADPLDGLVGELGRDTALDPQDADDEQTQPAVGAPGLVELGLHQQLIADPCALNEPLYGLGMGVENQPDPVADDVGAAGVEPLRNEYVDLPELGGRQVHANFLGLHMCSFWNPTGVCTEHLRSARMVAVYASYGCAQICAPG